MPDDHTPHTVTACYGEAADISHHVNSMPPGKAILVIPPQGTPDAAAAALQGFLQETAQLFLRESAENMHKRREMLIAALMPSLPAGMLKQAGMEARSRTAVLAASEWLTTKDIAERAGLSAANASSTPWKWRQDGRIFAISAEGKDLYPGYSLDAEDGYRPLKALKSILDVFGERKGTWGTASWFASANSFLGGRRPMDLLKSEPGKVLAAAKDEITGVAHG
ncbi:MAG: hypothetical protein ABW202_17885 [Duganella sp.]